MGAFAGFIDHPSVRLIGVEAGGISDKPGQHARRLLDGSTGIVEGYKSLFLQDDDGQLQPTHSISAGLDYPGIGPELAYLCRQKRVAFACARDAEVVKAFDLVAKTEGILPALESSHALAHAIKLAPTLTKDTILVVNVSGRGDKDLFILAAAFADDSFYAFLKAEAVRHGQ